MTYNDYYLQHHGIRGQKWGIRRYQNPDGSLTEEGKRRLLSYKVGEKRLKRRENYLSTANNKILARPGKAYLGTVRNEQAAKQTRDILKDSQRVYDAGKRTIGWRAGIGAIGTAVTAGAGITAALITGSIPITAIASSAAAGLTLLSELQTRR